MQKNVIAWLVFLITSLEVRFKFWSHISITYKLISFQSAAHH